MAKTFQNVTHTLREHFEELRGNHTLKTKKDMPYSSISTDYEAHANSTTKRYQLTLVRITMSKKTTNNNCSRCCGEMHTLNIKGDITWKGPRMRTEWRCLKKVNIELPYDPAGPLLDL